MPPRRAAHMYCLDAAAAGSIHWAESPAALNHQPPPVLTSAFVAIGCMASERVGATSCAKRATSSAKRATSSASSGSVRKQSAKFQAAATKAAARETTVHGRSATESPTTARSARARREGVSTQNGQKGQNRISHFLGVCPATFWLKKKGAPPQSDPAPFQRDIPPRKYFS